MTRVDELSVAAYEVPTDAPESDGTLIWESTTLVVVTLSAGGEQGIGYTYADRSAAQLIAGKLAGIVIGKDVLDIESVWLAMHRAIRNLGRPGVAATAMAAIDAALWDLKARLAGLPLVKLLGQVRESCPVYGSGGFTSYSVERLQHQLGGWVDMGMKRVKMKVGRDPAGDEDRVAAARAAIGDRAELFVDANGAYDRKQALRMAELFADQGVTWFEEPVSSDDLEGLRFLRERAPAGMDVAAGEYGYDLFYFRRMLEAGAVDVLQADATRCAGPTGWLKAAVLCEAHCLRLSAHTAPALHAHVCCGSVPAVHIEYFHDHVRIEQMLFEGVLEPRGGALAPDVSRPGLGLELKETAARPYLTFGPAVTKRDGG